MRNLLSLQTHWSSKRFRTITDFNKVNGNENDPQTMLRRHVKIPNLDIENNKDKKCQDWPFLKKIPHEYSDVVLTVELCIIITLDTWGKKKKMRNKQRRIRFQGQQLCKLFVIPYLGKNKTRSNFVWLGRGRNQTLPN